MKARQEEAPAKNEPPLKAFTNLCPSSEQARNQTVGQPTKQLARVSF